MTIRESRNGVLSTLSARKKILAAALMIAFLATLVSSFGIPAAARQAVKAPPARACTFEDLDKKMLPLELGCPLPSVLQGNSKRALCILHGFDEMLDADTLFLISYSALNLTVFLFLVAAGRARPALIWLFVGLLLTLGMLLGDLAENHFLRELIKLARNPDPRAQAAAMPGLESLLKYATSTKWLSLAVAGLLLSLIYLAEERFFLRIVSLPAFGTAVLVSLGLSKQSPWMINQGMAMLATLWLGALIHAVIVAIESPSPGVPQATGPGEPHA
ncbi:MAG TPA: hypothetical protein VGS07_02290 [Thermoanaerobaculia bacterium]|nr:hypothetical protein [Thermoanaerobaculia bacterium]